MNKRLIAAFSALVTAAALVGAGNVNAATSGLPGTNWWSSFQVQNVGTMDGTLVIQAYTQVGSQAAQYSSSGFTIMRGGGLTYNPGFAPNYPAGNRIGFCSNTSSCTDDLPPGFTGAVVASADVPIVAIGTVNNTKNGSVGNDGGRATGSYAAFGGDKVAAELFFPVAKHNFVGNTVIYYVQAAGVDASVTITYTMNDGSIHTQSQAIGANRTFLFDPANATPAVLSTGCIGGGVTAATSPCLGSARVLASSGVIAGVALEYPHTPAGLAGYIGSSRAFVPSDYTKTILAPIFKYDFAGSWTGFAVQNTTNLTATVDVTFTVARALSPNTTPVGTQYIVHSEKIGPYQQTVFSKFRPNVIGTGMAGGVALSAIVVGDQPLVAVMNESQIDAASPTPLLGTYNAFNPSNATMSVAAPVVKEYFPGGQNGTSAARAGDSVSVQNAGTANADIQVRYTAVSSSTAVPAGTSYTLTIGVNKGAGGTTQLLAPGASYVFNMVTLASRASMYAVGRDGTIFPKDGVNYAVMVISNQPIIAMIQEDNKPPTGSPADVFNYEGFSQ